MPLKYESVPHYGSINSPHNTMRTINKLTLNGAIGNALKASGENRLKKVDYRFMAKPFLLRNEGDNGWRCEFWGKVTRSAILTNRWLNDEELARNIRGGIDAILESQTPDGCISSYPADKQCKAWDIWGRKYVLLTLLRYYECCGKQPEILEAASRMTDHLFRQLQEMGIELCHTGFHGGLASCSILTGLMKLYSHTGEKRYLDYAERIVDFGEKWTHDIFEAAANGFLPSEIGNAKAYELTSCFEGLADYLLARPDDTRLKACMNYFNGVRTREIFITGAGGLKDRCGEYWASGAFHQTETGHSKGMLGETCITTTWLHFCRKISRLAPDSTLPYDEAERSIYNALLGAMTPDGTNWCHQNPTPLAGKAPRVPSPDQILHVFGVPFDGHDCCRAQGPEGLAYAPLLFLEPDIGGAISLNLYEPMTADFSDGSRLTVTGGYPFKETTTVHLETPAETRLRLRIPKYCTGVSLNGAPMPAKQGEFLEISRKWIQADEVTLHFDLAPKEVAPPNGSAFTAVTCGPIVMAEDSRGNVPTAHIQAQWNGRHLVDYATAGNLFRQDNTLTVWFAK